MNNATENSMTRALAALAALTVSEDALFAALLSSTFALFASALLTLV